MPQLKIPHEVHLIHFVVKHEESLVAASGTSCLRDASSSSLTRDPTVPCTGSRVSATGPPGRSLVLEVLKTSLQICFLNLINYQFLAALDRHCSVWISHCGAVSCSEAQALGVRLQQLQHSGSQLWLTGSGERAQQLWHKSLAALWCIESSWTRVGARVCCIGRQIFIHCATREVQKK